MNKNFYSDLRAEVLYREGEQDPRIHLYDGSGMHPQFVIPNMTAARQLRDVLTEILKNEKQKGR